MRTAHIRKPIGRAWGNGFYKVVLSDDQNGTQTLCGAPAALDLGYADFSCRRPDFDWAAEAASWINDPAIVCAECLAEAAKVRDARKAAKARKNKR